MFSSFNLLISYFVIEVVDYIEDWSLQGYNWWGRIWMSLTNCGRYSFLWSENYHKMISGIKIEYLFIYPFMSLFLIIMIDFIENVNS